MTDNPFALDLTLIRERARNGDAHKSRIERTERSRPLNGALATELGCTLRYEHAHDRGELSGKTSQLDRGILPHICHFAIAHLSVMS